MRYLFNESLVPYLLALLEWTYPVVSYRSANDVQKWCSAYSAALICEKLLPLER